MVETILKYPASALLTGAEPVTVFGAALEALAQTLVETCDDSRGAGLAAP